MSGFIRKKLNIFLSVVLTLTLVLSGLSLAWADETGNDENSTGDKREGEVYQELEALLEDMDESEYEGFMVILKDDLPGDQEAEIEEAIDDADGIDPLEYTDGVLVADTIEDIETALDEECIEAIVPDCKIYIAEEAYSEDETGDIISIQSATSPNDTYYSEQYNIVNMNVPYAWEWGYEGQDMDTSVDMDNDGNAGNDDIIVAVIDSGININHKDFDKSKFITNKARNFSDEGGSTDITDNNGHGTRVAGIIAAEKDNRTDIAGIAPGVKILPIKVTNAQGEAQVSKLIDALNYLSTEKKNFATSGGTSGINVAVVNISLSTAVKEAEPNTAPVYRYLYTACKRAIDQGMILLAAAGNNYSEGNYSSYPAQFVIGVGSVDRFNNVCSFSQRLSPDNQAAGLTGDDYRNKVWVTAPGSWIYSLKHTENGDNQYKSGTSFSCPEVTALAAILKSLCNDLTHDEFKEILKVTAVFKKSGEGLAGGQDYAYGWGIIDYQKTIDYVRTVTKTNPVDPTCTKAGGYDNSIYCNIHNKITFDGSRTLPALGHDYGAWVRISATQHRRVCKRDSSHVETQNHTWDSGKVTKEATLTSTGIKTYTCTGCGATKTETIPKATVRMERAFGPNRYETAFNIATVLKKEKGGSKFKNIVVASGSNFPDGLSGAYLAKVKEAPLILTSKAMDAKAITFIRTHLETGGGIYILGGPSAVSESFENNLKSYGIYKVTRLGGANRYETNRMILWEAGVKSEEILVCSGTSFPDSLSASAVGKPILLVGKSLTPSQRNYLKTLSTKKFYIIGGSSAVSDSVKKEIDAFGDRNSKRIWGSNRYETSVQVAENFFKGKQNVVVLASGAAFPDGLSGGPLAMEIGGPIILANKNIGAGSSAQKYISSHSIMRSITLGGSSIISDDGTRTLMKSTGTVAVIK